MRTVASSGEWSSFARAKLIKTTSGAHRFEAACRPVFDSSTDRPFDACRVDHQHGNLIGSSAQPENQWLARVVDPPAFRITEEFFCIDQYGFPHGGGAWFEERWHRSTLARSCNLLHMHITGCVGGIVMQEGKLPDAEGSIRFALDDELIIRECARKSGKMAFVEFIEPEQLALHIP